MKFCRTCQEWKETFLFQRDASRHDGLKDDCSECRSMNNGQRCSGPIRVIRQIMKVQQDSAWCRMCDDWHPSSQVRNGLCHKHQRAEERERYASNSGVRMKRKQHAHSRKRNVEPIEFSTIEALQERFTGQCAYCLEPATTWDHIVPVSRGGTSQHGNILPACNHCNSSKKASPLSQWISKRMITLSDDVMDIVALAAELGLSCGED
jgi:hypothetical protein